MLFQIGESLSRVGWHWLYGSGIRRSAFNGVIAVGASSTGIVTCAHSLPRLGKQVVDGTGGDDGWPV